MASDDRRTQSLAAKLAEAERPFVGYHILASEAYAAPLRERAALALSDARALADRGIALSPFLEIGAGSGQRSLALQNACGATGVASDISRSALRNAPYVLSVLDYVELPLLLCCDAHRLPFLPCSFAFVFAYRTLHHLNDPEPVVAECYRVLAKGGHWFCNEEPLDTPLKRRLRGDRVLSRPPTRLQRIATRLGIERYFWDDVAVERAAGITEARFLPATWRRALRPFAHVEMEINRRLRVHTDLRRPGLSRWIAERVGGNVKALCRKEEGEALSGPPTARLMCLRCGATMHLGARDEPFLTCTACGRRYPILNGILCMLPDALETALCAPQTAFSESSNEVEQTA